MQSTADLMAVSLLFLPLYVLASAIMRSPNHLILAIVSGILYVLASLLLLPRVTARHIDLSNSQLKYITVHCRVELRCRLRQAAQSEGESALRPR